MAWYIRKSIRINKLLRLNLSKSGLGFSAGVKGARIGINSQGKPYTHVGRHGIYARKVYGGRRTTGTSNVEISNEAALVIAIICIVLAVIVGAWGGGIGLLLLLLTSAIWAPVVGLIAFGIVWVLKRIDRSAKAPLDIAEQKKRQWQQEPMTPLQEAHICFLFDERELPRTAKYTDGKTGLAAFKAAHGQPSQKDAAGLISFLESLPIRRGQIK